MGMRNKLDPREVTVGILDCLGKKAILPTTLEESSFLQCAPGLK